MISAGARKPGRILARTLLFGTGALFAAGLLTWTPSVVSSWSQGAAEGTLWQLLNGARVNNGMAPLQQHSTLIGLARWRSQDMLNRNYFSHTIPGCGCAVYAYYDSNGVNYVWGGENIGWNSGLADGDSPVAVHNAFMNSSGHRANVLNRSFTHGGVGGAAADNQEFLGYVQNTRMYTELFMQAPTAAAPAPAPAAPAPAAPTAARPAAGAAAPAPARAAAPAAAGAPAAAAAPAEPTPAEVAVAAPVRPQSAAVDGTSRPVFAEWADFAERHLTHPAERAIALSAAAAATAAAEQGPAHPADAVTPAAAEARTLEIAAAEPAEPGFFESFFGALFGLISG